MIPVPDGHLLLTRHLLLASLDRCAQRLFHRATKHRTATFVKNDRDGRPGRRCVRSRARGANKSGRLGWLTGR